jgi:hypothetical protein
VATPSEFIPVHYSGESLLDKAQVVRITPFMRKVFLALHRAQAADFDEYKWILINGISEVWYEKPPRFMLKHMAKLQGSGCELPDLVEIAFPRLVVLDAVKVWASAALTTPTDDDIYDCTGGHVLEKSDSVTCYHCTDEKSDALDATELIYYLVLSSYQKGDPNGIGGHHFGKQVYRLIRCGSRAAAAAEAFFAAGVKGCEVVFSCVTRFGETFEDRNGPVERVSDLWKLAEDAKDENTIRVFY